RPARQAPHVSEPFLWLASSPIRFFHLRALAHLAARPPWRYAAAAAGADRGDECPAGEDAQRGLYLIRYHPGEGELPGNHRGSFRYRSLFRVARGNASWRRGDFKSAYRDFDLARSGLEPSDRLHAAEAELAAAECALAHAHDLADRDDQSED